MPLVFCRFMCIYIPKIHYIFCYKIIFNGFFLPFEESFFSFYHLFLQKFTKSLFFFKCVSLKKKHIYTFSEHPLRLANQEILMDVFTKNDDETWERQEEDVYMPDIDINDSADDDTDSTGTAQPTTFSIQKTFLMYKKRSIKHFIAFFKFKHLRRRHLFNFFSSFRHSTITDLTTFFSLNFLKLLNRIFPFFNFFFLKLMVARGLILINFKKITTNFCSLRVGDFVSFFIIKDIWDLISTTQLVQFKHLEKVRTKLFNFYQTNDLNNLKTKSTYASKHFFNLSVFFRKQPAWVEVDYLSFSFFIIKKSPLLNFSFYFNPFLYRLLEFK